MSTTTATSSGAELSGRAWGARARDWGDTEAQQVPTYEEAIRRAGIGAGKTVLDIGCGTGVFLRVAADHGATVCGIDASAALLEIARERVSAADLARGDLQHLPYADDSFDVVCGFNAFFYADDMVAALRDAVRLARRAGRDPGVRPPRGLRPPPHEGRPRPLRAPAARAKRW